MVIIAFIEVHEMTSSSRQKHKVAGNTTLKKDAIRAHNTVYFNQFGPKPFLLLLYKPCGVSQDMSTFMLLA